jgi:hypothetical protein
MIVHDQQMNHIDFGVKGLKVMVTVTFVGKNGFRVITKEHLGLETSNLV